MIVINIVGSRKVSLSFGVVHELGICNFIFVNNKFRWRWHKMLAFYTPLNNWIIFAVTQREPSQHDVWASHLRKNQRLSRCGSDDNKRFTVMNKIWQQKALERKLHLPPSIFVLNEPQFISDFYLNGFILRRTFFITFSSIYLKLLQILKMPIPYTLFKIFKIFIHKKDLWIIFALTR